MRFLRSLLFLAAGAHAASSWGFDDASLTISNKKATEQAGPSVKEQYVQDHGSVCHRIYLLTLVSTSQTG